MFFRHFLHTIWIHVRSCTRSRRNERGSHTISPPSIESCYCKQVWIVFILCTWPLSWLFASENVFCSREEGHRKDDDLSRFMRLFIVVPKDDEEDENTLQYYFQTFGEVESVKILRYRGTNESKGFAYVTFNRWISNEVYWNTPVALSATVFFLECTALQKL